MKPDPKRFLDVAAAQLLTKTGPALGGYEQSSIGLMAVMLLEVAAELDRAAARRVEENTAIRRLFAAAMPVVASAALRRLLEQASRTRDEDLSVSALELANAQLRSLLIRLHAHVEQLNSPDARRIESAIWRELRDSTQRRRLNLGVF